MNDTLLMTGVEVPIPELAVSLHQPTIKEISYIGEEDYFTGVQILCFNKDVLIASQEKTDSAEAISGLNNMNNFQIFMALVGDKTQQSGIDKKALLVSIFTILFPNFTATFLPRGIYFNNPTTKMNFTVDENNFDILRNAIHKVSGLDNTASGQNAGFNPKNQLAAKIAAKLMRGRSRASASKGEKNHGVLSRYVSILTIGLNSMSLQDCLNLTIYQLYDLIERYGLHVGWDIDIRSRLAGGKPDSKPDDWMKNIH